jgi:hypothetical protein
MLWWCPVGVFICVHAEPIAGTHREPLISQ